MSWLTSPWPFVVLAILGTVLLAFFAWYSEWRAQQAYEHLVTTGESAEATVLSAKDSGWRTNGRPHIVYELEVRRLGHPPYRAKAKLQINRPWSSLPYGPGMILRVRVDRDRPERVVIEGGEAVLGGARFSPPLIDLGDIAANSFSIGKVSSGDLFMVNGTSYASREEMPPEVRAGFEEAMDALQGVLDPAERLRELKALYDEGLLTAEEYEAKRAAIVEKL